MRAVPKVLASTAALCSMVLMSSTITSVAAATPTDPDAAPLASVVGGEIPASIMKSSAAPGSTWKPGAARYGVGKAADFKVKMADGTTLRADVYFPTDSTGKQAKGMFPVLLTQSPYGKDTLGAGAKLVASGLSQSEYLVKRGYIDVVADVRGSGASEGTFGLFDPEQVSDSVELVKWASKRPGSNGKVGLHGASFLGINQILTAGSVGKNSALKAIFPVVPANDLYKDTATMGGLLDLSFDLFYLSSTGALNTAGPLVNAAQNPANIVSALFPTQLQHLAAVGTFNVAFAAKALLGQPEAFNDEYWQDRNPNKLLKNIVASKIPAYMVGGHFDLFQRGQPLNYTGLQNAYSGRPVDGPMSPTQKATGRYQLLTTPFAHVPAAFQNYDPLMLRWFDTWLKGKDTGMAKTPTPLHVWDLGTKKYTEHNVYPYPTAKPTRFFFNGKRSTSATLLGNSGSLTTQPATSGSDPLIWSPVGNPCGPPTDQWFGGVPSAVTRLVSPQTPCINNDPLGRLGLNQATYTTEPLEKAKAIAGPITVSIQAKATTAQTEWVASISDIAPDGTIIPLTQGALLGTLRALDPVTTWRAKDGQILQAGHTYSRASVQPVVPGKSTRYEVEVFPTFATIAPGHRIRVTISTADTPHLVPTVPDIAKLLGGVYQVERGGIQGSAVTIPLK